MTNPNPKVSIAVLIYNSGLYLDRCLGSIAKQTFQNIEVDLIYTESTDFSYTIIQKYIKLNPDVFKLHQTNFQSIAKSRSQALSVASGEYLIYVDGDDWVEPDYIEKLVSKAAADDADVVVCNFRTYSDRGVKEYPLHLYDNTIDMLNHNVRYMSVLWNKLFKLSFIRKYNFNFDPSLIIGEDVYFVYQVLLNNPKIIFITDMLYNYRNNYKSITRKKNKTQIQDDIKVINFFEGMIKERKLEKDYDEFLKYRKFELKTNYLFALPEPDFPEFEACYPEIKDIPKYSRLSGIKRIIFKSAIKQNYKTARFWFKFRRMLKKIGLGLN